MRDSLRDSGLSPLYGAWPAVEAEAAGDGEDPNQALIDAIEADAEQRRQLADEQAQRDEALRQAQEAQAQALRDVKASIDAQLAFAHSVSAVTSMQAVRAMSDVISGQVGQNAGQRGTMPGTGRLASVGNSRY